MWGGQGSWGPRLPHSYLLCLQQYSEQPYVRAQGGLVADGKALGCCLFSCRVLGSRWIPSFLVLVGTVLQAQYLTECPSFGVSNCVLIANPIYKTLLQQGVETSDRTWIWGWSLKECGCQGLGKKLSWLVSGGLGDQLKTHLFHLRNGID